MSKKRYIGYWGCPPRDIVEKYRRAYPDDEFLDLDVDMGSAPSGIAPDAYCQILTNIMDNAARFIGDIRLVIAPVGEDKCDGGRFAALILRDMGLSVETVRNHSTDRKPVRIAESNLPLPDKVTSIMDGVIAPYGKEVVPSVPTHGFWGVPPHDMRLLELFPETTHVFGWVRCVEAEVPSDLRLETFVNPDIPTVFYAQTFCQKTFLARYLADKYRGLYIDCDGPLTSSVIAKVTAFIRLG